jgi:polyferredoxin
MDKMSTTRSDPLYHPTRHGWATDQGIPRQDLCYATLLALVFIGGVVALINRNEPVSMSFATRNSLYRETAAKRSKMYLLRVLNKRMTPRTFNLTIEGFGDAPRDGGMPHWKVGLLAGGVLPRPRSESKRPEIRFMAAIRYASS